MNCQERINFISNQKPKDDQTQLKMYFAIGSIIGKIKDENQNIRSGLLKGILDEKSKVILSKITGLNKVRLTKYYSIFLAKDIFENPRYVADIKNNNKNWSLEVYYQISCFTTNSILDMLNHNRHCLNDKQSSSEVLKLLKNVFPNFEKRKYSYLSELEEMRNDLLTEVNELSKTISIQKGIIKEHKKIIKKLSKGK